LKEHRIFSEPAYSTHWFLAAEAMLPVKGATRETKEAEAPP